MLVEQVYELLNQITGELTGKEDLVTNDLSNVIDVGTAIFDATSVDNNVKSLVNKVGKVIAVIQTALSEHQARLVGIWLGFTETPLRNP